MRRQARYSITALPGTCRADQRASSSFTVDCLDHAVSAPTKIDLALKALAHRSQLPASERPVRTCFGALNGFSLPGAKSRSFSDYVSIASVVSRIGSCIEQIATGTSLRYLEPEYYTEVGELADRYLFAFDKTANVDSVSRPLPAAKSGGACLCPGICGIIRSGNGAPIGAEARLTITGLINLKKYEEEAIERDTRPTKFHLTSCVSSERRKVVISARYGNIVAENKDQPAFTRLTRCRHIVSGTVTLNAIIGADGHIAGTQNS